MLYGLIFVVVGLYFFVYFWYNTGSVENMVNIDKLALGDIMNGFISKIQRYSTKDGPGVRTTVFAVGCNLNCHWCANPELIDDGVKFLYHPNRCVKCGACVEKSDGTIQLTDEGCIIDRKNTNLEECSSVCYYDAYERIGEAITANELVDKLLRDKVFYDQSNGGVTFSGGDAVLQADFFHEVALILKSNNVHVALDTAGFFSWEKLEPLIKAVDLILYDIKILDNTQHKYYTGVDNRLILENAIKIADMGKDMIVRMILIPGVNDSESEIVGRLNFVKNLGSKVKLDLLKHHKLGAGKYAGLGLVDPMEQIPACSNDVAEYAENLARNMNIAVTIGG